MAQEAENDAAAQPPPPKRRWSWRRRVVYPLLLILGLALLATWVQRKQLADDAIGAYLRAHHVRATYKIDRIGGTRQVLSNIVVGDPAHPDLTVERAEVDVRYRFGIPAIGKIVLDRPRLYGTYVGGKLSFGALDPLLFTGKKAQPFEFPAISLQLNDGRALLETDYGPVGIAARGHGYLRGGFAGVLAATAPKLALGDCTAEGATLYGKIGIDAERPTFDGPLRWRSLACGDGLMHVAQSSVGIAVRLDRNLAGGDGKLSGSARALHLADATAAALRLTGKASYRGGTLAASYDIAVDGLSHPQARLAHLTANGALRAGNGALQAQAQFGGGGFRPGAAVDLLLRQAARSTGGTLAGPLLDKLRSALLREANGSSFSGQASLRRTGEVLSIVVPQASFTGGSGERVLSLSRFQYGSGGGGLPRISGNFATAGAGLPRIEGRVEQRGTGGFTARLAMATYQAGGGSLAVPELAIVSKGDRIGFAGRAIVSGDLPGGEVEGLLLPLSGAWSSGAGLTLWRQCTAIAFDHLRFANLTLERHGLTICPAKTAPILRYGPAGLRLAAGVASLDLAGHLGTTPIAVRSGPVGFAYPGTISARKLLVSLGPRATATTFAISDLTARIGRDIAGHFGGTDVKLFAVPLDILDAQGAWDYTGGRLTIADGAFRLVDRHAPARFEPLVAQGATLTLKDNVITAEAVLREPKSRAEVTKVDLRHDLASGRGHADLAVPGLTFAENGLQPKQLTSLALGVVANVAGTVTGTGRIDWDEKGITSSGKFSSNSLDFAAVFGPVKGASGTIVFTDLLGLTTAPDQVLKVASINPGIEVDNGVVSIELRNGQALTLNRGSWPFMGGTLTMRPVTLNLGVSEQRAYVLDIEGLEAGQFVDRMDLENISATGTFDGEIPLIFDASGTGRLEGGHLQSRGGGNISYVGALTYKDLSPMANVAFEALRSLDYNRMTVGMDGPLTGEIVTKVRFEGVSQGKGAKQNFITRRIAKLPFRFVVTVTAPFYKLITSIKSMYDPTMVRDPQDLAGEGLLLDANGNAVAPGDVPRTPKPPATTTPTDANIQRPESEHKP